MRTKIPILFFALFLSAPAFAQQPRIDSIAVDEDKGELVLHGNFQNSASAIVLVDSVSLPITLASDTLIRATIPDSGKGSCGPVKVFLGGNVSNEKLITYFHSHAYYFAEHRFSDGGYEMRMSADTIHFRADLSFYTDFSQNEILLHTTRLSKCHDVASGNDGIHGYHYGGPKYDTSGILNAILHIPYDYDFRYYIDGLEQNQGDQGIICNILLNNDFSIASGNRGPSCYWGPIAATDFPPTSASVHETPSDPNILQAHLSSDPVASNAEMKITLRETMKVRMEMMDILGHIVFLDVRVLSAGENKLPMNSAHQPSGIYICRLQAGGEVMSVRFVKE